MGGVAVRGDEDSARALDTLGGDVLGRVEPVAFGVGEKLTFRGGASSSSDESRSSASNFSFHPNESPTRGLTGSDGTVGRVGEGADESGDEDGNDCCVR